MQQIVNKETLPLRVESTGHTHKATPKSLGKERAVSEAFRPVTNYWESLHRQALSVDKHGWLNTKSLKAVIPPPVASI